MTETIKTDLHERVDTVVSFVDQTKERLDNVYMQTHPTYGDMIVYFSNALGDVKTLLLSMKKKETVDEDDKKAFDKEMDKYENFVKHVCIGYAEILKETQKGRVE
jgi:predicted phosphohydrolase